MCIKKVCSVLQTSVNLYLSPQEMSCMLDIQSLQIKTTFPIKPKAVKKDFSIDLLLRPASVNTLSSECLGSVWIARLVP